MRDGGRTPSRREARMATSEIKRATPARRSLCRERERATVATATYVRMSYNVMWGTLEGAIGGVMGSTARVAWSTVRLLL
jgi:hypothetical protein